MDDMIFLSEQEKERVLAANPEWAAEFMDVKSGRAEALELIYKTKSEPLLRIIAGYLQQQSALEDSRNAEEHFTGYLAKVNLNICKSKIRKLRKG